jgi:OFA family oxalate/formate antiporter-like MFS transporter
MVASGVLLRRLGPRGCAVTGGIIFGGGWVVAGLGAVHFAFTVIGVGLLGGVGVGFAYVVPIAIGMLWFPQHKGLVTGVTVAGFAGGAALVSQLGERLTAAGLSPFHAFTVLGCGFAVVVCGAGLLMRYPEDHVAIAAAPAPLREKLRDRRFVRLYLCMFAGLAAGLTVIPNIKQFCPVAVGGAIPILAVANAAGRVCWGWIFDRWLQIGAIRLNLLCQGLLLVLAPLLIDRPAGLLLAAALAGFNYGGVLVLYASATAQCWGTRQVAQIYGWLFSANIPASAAPLLAGAVFDRTRSFTPAFLALAALLFAAACTRADRSGPGRAAGM